MKKQSILSQHDLNLIFKELKRRNMKQKIRERGGGESSSAPKKKYDAIDSTQQKRSRR
jgi:hypothetical protein